MDYDSNPIEVFTQYSYEQMKAFQRFHLRKMRRLSIIINCFYLLSVAGFVFLLIYREPGPAPAPTASPPSPFSLFFVLFPPLLLLFSSGIFYTRKVHAKATKLIQNGQRYSFCNHDFAVSTEQQDNIWQGRTAYTVILEVWETRDMFYLYTAKAQAHLVDKRGFITGSPDGLRALLQSHIPANKYKIKL